MLIFGLYTLRNFDPYSPIDEGAHFDYVQSIAEDFELPKINDRIHEEVWAIAQGTYPDAPETPVEKVPGLAGRSYEAFQPPLYYAAAAAVFSIPVDHVKKLYLVRAFGLLLLFAALIPFGLLLRDLVGDRWPLGLAFGGVVFLLPGVLERAVLVGNIALEVPMAALFVWLVHGAYKRDSLRWLAASGAALGLCLLTKTTLIYLAPVFGLAMAVHLWRHHTRRDVARVVAIGALPLLLLAPWLGWNLDAYGTVTANGQAANQQRAIINPDNIDYHLYQEWDAVPFLIDFSFPQEWGEQAQRSIPTMMRNFLLVAMFLLPLVVGYRLWTRGNLIATFLLVLPMLVGIATLIVITVRTDFTILLARYLHAALPAWGAAAFVAWDGAMSSERALRNVNIAMLVAITYLWVGYAQASF